MTLRYSTTSAGTRTLSRIRFRSRFLVNTSSSLSTPRFGKQVAFHAPGKRVFKIMIGDCVLQERVDVFQLAGGRIKPLNLYFPIFFSGNSVAFKGKTCSGGYSGQSMSVSFVPIGVDNPMVNALVLVQGTLQGIITRHRLFPPRGNQGRVR
jgi:hypothetical protein